MAFAILYPIYFMLLFSLPFSAIAQTYRNVTLGSSLTASTNNNSSWASPSGDFAFGFRHINGTTEGYLLAIWFNKIPERTIIWSANRDNLVQSGSIIELTGDGRLVLRDNTGQQIWNVDSAGPGVSYGAMLDTGNFVVARNDSATLWGSFDEPTDTILPTQRLNEGSRLIASFSSTNYSRGRFGFTLQIDGNLLLYTRNFPLDSINSDYWSTSTAGSGFRVIFNQSGYIYLTASNGSVLNSITSNAVSTGQYYQRAIIDFDGVLRQYIYPKSSGSASGSPMAWSPLSSLPSDICMSIRQATGGGACGFNSYCMLGDDQRPKCTCPTGYSFIDPKDDLSACKPNFDPQNCDEESQEIDRFGFIDMLNTDWPDSDYEYFEPVKEDWCREACLRDCLCAVAIFRNDHCWKKKNPLSNGRIDSSVGGKALIKIREHNSTRKTEGGGDSKKKDQSTLIITGTVVLGISVFLNLLLLLSTWFAMSLFNSRKRKMLQPNPVVPGMNLRSFTYKELEEATDGFKDELGRGAFAIVYKGALNDENGKLVAVKKLDKIVKEGEQEFKAEISAIGRTNHKNLVQLLGYCNEGENRLLVYEFMSNGSLANFLSENSRPNWHKRIQAAFGIARGLYYLHEECSTQIVHCDIKPQNVLLDESFTAKIADFGLAKLLKTEQTRTFTAIRGTRGYVAPEWFKKVPVTAKVDVYSFGILLFELICCRRSVERDAKYENEIILSDWAYDCYKAGELNLLVQNDVEATNDMQRLEKFVMIAIWCIQEDPSLRPTMKKVTQMLEGAIEVSVPPDPSIFMSSI